MGRLDGRVAIVTGGTGALGRAVSEAFLREGATVIAPYVVPEEVPLLQGRVGDLKARLEVPNVDVGKEAQVKTLVQQVVAKHGKLDILVSLVGGFWGGFSVAETEEKDWDAMVNLNLKTAFFCCKTVVPEMKKRNGGRIVCVSSRTGALGAGDFAAYAVAKGAILTFVRSLAEEVLEDNITVNAIAPSTIDTEANRKAMPNRDHSKWVPPEEIAKVLVFLCSEDSQIISGALIPVYGKA